MRACCDPTQHMCRCAPTPEAYPKREGITFYSKRGRRSRRSRSTREVSAEPAVASGGNPPVQAAGESAAVAAAPATVAAAPVVAVAPAVAAVTAVVTAPQAVVAAEASRDAPPVVGSSPVRVS